ncbi:hypothetical protein CHLRE_13g591650v5 [Chlamydomonas reinhardtii]|uniref:Uncharacterized protein n=1 Tax=Chlamydomonas reinhardtii TaxID=3055 RepID=A0A2K3D153_CHLRE|nr:uncharacterized protein CHLRE_13g591650v5 [Chlamydomonas reinhardtii]PNW74260.1 hypothetical protein CHLRE_13g591650v5 [Chlamydomonas reinhardtii]
MTPPRVSGISLAPAPFDADHHHGAAAAVAAHSKVAGGRPSQTQLNIGGKVPPHPNRISLSGAVGGPSCAGVGGGAGAAGSSGPAASASGAAPLIAEGRSIQRGAATGLQLDPRLVAFHEINGGGGDSDSVCSTPVLSVHQLTRHEGDGAFGPLTPHPLSPSILTLCAQPGLDDQFEFGGVARATGELLDMRICDSPRLPSS